MEMTYGGALVMPSSYAMMDEEEMMYVEGSWSIKYSGVHKVHGAIVGVYYTFSGTVSDMAWIIGAAAACTVAIIGLCVPTGVGAAVAARATVATLAIIGFATTIIATNDWACNKKFSQKFYLSLV